jgi:DNA-binding MarR family transcriptional regulator
MVAVYAAADHQYSDAKNVIRQARTSGREMPPSTYRQEMDVSEEALRKNFGRLHVLHVEALTRHLVECRRVCDGDLDLFLVLMIIGERTFNSRNAPPKMSLAEFFDGRVANLAPTAINLQSIADYSGIPRETVRRKLDSLIEKGWVARDERKFISATDKARENLVDLTTSSLRYLRAMEVALDACAED